MVIVTLSEADASAPLPLDSPDKRPNASIYEGDIVVSANQIVTDWCVIHVPSLSFSLTFAGTKRFAESLSYQSIAIPNSRLTLVLSVLQAITYFPLPQPIQLHGSRYLVKFR